MAYRYDPKSRDWAIPFSDDARVVFEPKRSALGWNRFANFLFIAAELAWMIYAVCTCAPDHAAEFSFAPIASGLVPLVLGTFLYLGAADATKLKRIHKRLTLDRASPFRLEVDGKKIECKTPPRLALLSLWGSSACLVLIADTQSILLWFDFVLSGGGGIANPNRTYTKTELRGREGSAAVQTSVVTDSPMFSPMIEAFGEVTGSPLSRVTPAAAVFPRGLLQFPLSLSIGAMTGYASYSLTNILLGHLLAFQNESTRALFGILGAVAIVLLQTMIFRIWLRLGFGRSIDSAVREVQGVAIMSN